LISAGAPFQTPLPHTFQLYFRVLLLRRGREEKERKRKKRAEERKWEAKEKGRKG